jgi:copper chaperone CopZ
MMRTVLRIAVLMSALQFIPATASAELRRVQFKVEGMSCAYCNTTMSGALQKLEGVEKVQLVAESGLVIIELKADNKIALEQLRRIVRSNGYPTKEAEITARGRMQGAGAALAFDLLNGSSLTLSEAPTSSPKEIVEIKGVVTANDKNEERLRIVSVATLGARLAPQPVATP